MKLTLNAMDSVYIGVDRSWVNIRFVNEYEGASLSFDKYELDKFLEMLKDVKVQLETNSNKR